ncbi:KTSC domain-containing protein [Streptomyces sp. NPDC017448]|uniref:KTSC domain-containing protein n=1 Tax=Streptomyces sp. NPDC017448 TaxID=3364996 RepID=UPI0037914B34
MERFLASGGTDSAQLLPFRPTNTIGPEIGRRRRTQAAGYDGRSRTVRILFSEGESATSLNGPIYEYYDVPYRVWRMVKRNLSTGRTINRTLNNYRYARIR